jgi:hypothetical protein
MLAIARQRNGEGTAHPGADLIRSAVMGFDIDAYAQGATAVRYDDLDCDEFADRPLSEAGLRCLRSMSDIETHTVCYLRDLLVTPSHADPTVTTFLTMWNFEEYWHGEALAKVLAAHGIRTGDEHTRGVRKRLGWRDRISPINQAILANLVGNDYVAVHMTFGAINEWSAHAAYARLMARENHPVLSRLLTRIMKQETRHAAFYASQARTRLARSAFARKLTRSVLRAFWAPVGSGILPKADSHHLMRYLMSGPEGRKLLELIDEKTDRLPGLAGLHLATRAAARFGATA